MKKREKKYIALWLVMKRECRRLVSRPLYLFCMVIAPLFCYIFFSTLMDSGLPTNLPVGAVDMDQSATSRNLIRNLDAFGQTGVVAHYGSIADARIAVQEGKIYGFFYIPKGLSADAQSQRQPKISFYTNNSYLIAGSLLFKDMKMMSELAAGAAGRSAPVPDRERRRRERPGVVRALRQRGEQRLVRAALLCASRVRRRDAAGRTDASGDGRV